MYQSSYGRILYSATIRSCSLKFIYIYRCNTRLLSIWLEQLLTLLLPWPPFPDPASGGSDDWALGVAKVPLSYTMELRDEGVAGFVLPPNQILPAVRPTPFPCISVNGNHERSSSYYQLCYSCWLILCCNPFSFLFWGT